MKNIVVLISGSGTNLQAIMDAIESGLIVNARIAAVVSNRPQARGLQRAQQRGIETCVIDHTDFTSRERFDSALQSRIEHWQPDLVILAGFMRILTDGFVAHFTGRMLNIHPSLLPKFKGLNTHARAIEAGEQEHGCSVHYVSSELDSGAVIGHVRVPVEMNDTPESLSKRVQVAEHQLFPACIDLCCRDQVRLTHQGVQFNDTVLPENGLDLTGRIS